MFRSFNLHCTWKSFKWISLIHPLVPNTWFFTLRLKLITFWETFILLYDLKIPFFISTYSSNVRYFFTFSDKIKTKFKLNNFSFFFFTKRNTSNRWLKKCKIIIINQYKLKGENILNLKKDWITFFASSSYAYWRFTKSKW